MSSSKIDILFLVVTTENQTNNVIAVITAITITINIVIAKSGNMDNKR